MKLLCIERDSFSPPKLRVGDIYTYTSEYSCAGCNQRWYTVAEISTPAKPTTGHCPKCKTKIDSLSTQWHFYSKRFVPWNPDSLHISAEEVKALYSPAPKVRA